MNYLFVHQNFPGQFLHVARALANDAQHRVVCIGEGRNLKGRPLVHSRIELYAYDVLSRGEGKSHHYVSGFETQIRRGQDVARVALALRQKGFEPDVVVVHPGWGEALFLKDVFLQAKYIHYFEFFYRSIGADVNFDPEFPSTLDDAFKLRIRNSAQLHALTSSDVGVSPTQWQKYQYPTEFASKIKVLHEGVDTQRMRPNGAAIFQKDAQIFRAGEEIITYVARNLEPYRGFHVFMRSLPGLLSARPNAQVLIVGGDEVSYGRRLPSGQSYRDLYTHELKDRVDWRRVHFLGKVPYDNYLQLLQVSAVHVYLTYPFVLSWSLLEAMSAGCAIVASLTAPVQEVMEDGQHGRLFDFFDTDALIAQVCDMLQYPEASAAMRQKARSKAIADYDLHSVCLPQWLSLLAVNPS